MEGIKKFLKILSHLYTKIDIRKIIDRILLCSKIVPKRDPLKHITQFFGLVGELCLIPIVWKSTQDKNEGWSYIVKVSKDPRQIIISTGVGFSCILFWTFLCIDLYFYYPVYILEKRIHECLIHLSCCAAFSPVIITMVHFIFFRTEIVETLNKTLGVYANRKDSAKENILLAWRQIDRLSLWFHCLMFCSITSIASSFWQQPTRRIHLYAFLPGCIHDVILIKIGMLLIEMFSNLIVWGIFATDIIFCVLCVQTENAALIALYRDTGGKEDNGRAISKYQQLRLLNTFLISGFGKFFLSGLIVAQSSALLTQAASIITLSKKGDTLLGTESSIFVALILLAPVAGLILGLLLMTSSKVRSNSKESLTELNKISSPTSKRSIATCKIFGIDFGALGVLSKITPLEFLNFFCSSLINILIMIEDL